MLLCNHISYVLRILLPTAIVLTPIENIMAITPTRTSNECLVTFENQPRISLMGAIVAYFRGALSMRRLLIAKVMLAQSMPTVWYLPSRAVCYSVVARMDDPTVRIGILWAEPNKR
ncbi:hypothetical protein RJZ90_000278 [Blastomyces dermatitidis]